jgi:hypothetical protein
VSAFRSAKHTPTPWFTRSEFAVCTFTSRGSRSRANTPGMTDLAIATSRC